MPAAFAAVRVGAEAHWDGGVYSNTPVEAVFDDRPRRDSVIFAVNVWQPAGAEPRSLWEVMARQKDIQYASRADSHIARQKQIHRLRHVIRELTANLSPAKREECRELSSWGCSTAVHVLRLLAPALASEDLMKDIDFRAAGIRERREAGYADCARMIEAAPWKEVPESSIEGVLVPESPTELLRNFKPLGEYLEREVGKLHQAATVLITMLGIVFLVDILSAWLRRHLGRSEA